MSRGKNPLCEFTPNSQGTIAKLVVREELIGPNGQPVNGGGGSSSVSYQTTAASNVVIAADVTDILGIAGYNVAAGRSLLCSFTMNVRSVGPAQPTLTAEFYRFNGEVTQSLATSIAHYVADEVDDATVQLAGLTVVNGDGFAWSYFVRLTVDPSVNPGIDDYTVLSAFLLLTEVDTSI